MKTQERVFAGNPVSSGEEHGNIDTAYKYRLPNGLCKACGKTENLVTSGGLVQPGFLYPRLKCL